MPETEWQKRHREIEELHRTILARMDQSEKRAAAREKERAERRTAQEAEIRLSVSEGQVRPDTASEPIKLDMKRWVETWDRFFQILEERLPKKRADEANG